jgi:hypothetical protein
MMSVLMALMSGCAAKVVVTEQPLPAGGTQTTIEADGVGATQTVQRANALRTTENLAENGGMVNMSMTDDSMRVSTGPAWAAVPAGQPLPGTLLLSPNGAVPVTAGSTLPNPFAGAGGTSPPAGQDVLYAPCPTDRLPANQAEVNGCAQQDITSIAGR